MPRDVFLTFSVFFAVFAGWPSSVSTAAALSFCFLVDIGCSPLASAIWLDMELDTLNERKPEHQHSDTGRHEAELAEHDHLSSPTWIAIGARPTTV